MRRSPFAIWLIAWVALTLQVVPAFSAGGLNSWLPERFLNGKPLAIVNHPADNVQLSDAGTNEGGLSVTATHNYPPSSPYTSDIGRPTARHSGGVTVGFMDGHVKHVPMTRPFYPPFGDPTLGNGITDPTNPNYLDGMWDPAN